MVWVWWLMLTLVPRIDRHSAGCYHGAYDGGVVLPVLSKSVASRTKARKQLGGYCPTRVASILKPDARVLMARQWQSSLQIE